ncbi:protein MANBAL [Ranitomeya imitator]|uniref:protein MANBAL n=1 Tax=Ranitomeya imitator TaxID=111125 RepID=UPI0037E860E3
MAARHFLLQSNPFLVICRGCGCLCLRTSRTMPEPLDLSPPDIPEPTFLETLLRYGLFCGAIFQLICILAIIFPGSKSQEMDTETSEAKITEVVKKPKTVPVTAGKKQKKETKKKR